jgi:hypothetical protein
MTSSSSLYGSSQTTGATSSSNFTTLYSGGSGPAPQGNLVIPGTLTVNGCAILTNCTSFSLLPTNAESILFGGASTSMSIGSSTGTTTINNQLATANYAFPIADGVNGQVLVTDGAGNLSFAAVTTVGKTYNIDASATTGGANFNLTSDIPTTDTIKFANGSNMSIVRTDANTITFTATDTNTTYAISSASTTGGANLTLTGSDSSTDSVAYKGAGATTVTSTDANTITITSTDTNTTYTQDVSSTTGGANLNLTGSDSTVDPVKFAGGTNVTVTATDANTITISTVADNIPDGTAQGEVLVWDGSQWTANNVVSSSASADRFVTQYINSNPGPNSALFVRKDYGATNYSESNNDGVGITYSLKSDSQGINYYGITEFEYSATNPQFVIANSTDNFTLDKNQIFVVDSTGAAITGDLDVRGGNITNSTNTGLEISADGTTPVTLTRNTTTTNANVRGAALNVQSTGTPTVGFGNSLEFQVEAQPGNTERAGSISVTSTNLTAGSEDFDFNVY